MEQNQRKDSKKAASFIYFALIILLIELSDLIFFTQTKQYLEAFLCVIAGFSVFLLPVFFLRNHLRLYSHLLFPIVLLVPFTFGCIVFFNLPVNDSILLLVVNSNKEEAMELVNGFFLTFTLVISVCLGLYYYFQKRVPTTLPRKQAAIASGISVVILLSLPFFDATMRPYFRNIRSRLYTFYPTSLLYGAKVVYKQFKLIRDTESYRAAFRFHAAQSTRMPGKQVHLLIIGESARADHWSLNGYKRNTSPLLAKRANLLSFTNTTTAAFITELSVPLIVTSVPPDSFDKHVMQQSVVGIFKEAGFTTWWITNQIDNGHIKLHLQEADSQYLFFNDIRATKNVYDDMQLLGNLKKALDAPGEKKFIVLHTQGSHYDYSARYPDKFDRFQPSNKTVFSKSNDASKKDVLVNSYDNSILFTDAVLDSAITMIAQQNAFSTVFYVSDHGENLFDDERNLHQHGYPIPSRFLAKVPFFVWYSDSLKQVAPEKIAALAQRLHQKTSAENIVPTLTHLCGISYPALDTQKCITHNAFQEPKQRMLGANNRVYYCDSLQ